VVAGHLRKAAIHVLQQASHGGLPKVDDNHFAGLCLQVTAIMGGGGGYAIAPRKFLTWWLDGAVAQVSYQKLEIFAITSFKLNGGPLHNRCRLTQCLEGCGFWILNSEGG
jgi:hypothetical protein